MKEFTHTIRLDTHVDDGLHQAFSNMLNATRDSMNAIAARQDELQKNVEELTRQTEELRAAQGRPHDGPTGVAFGSFGRIDERVGPVVTEPALRKTPAADDDDVAIFKKDKEIKIHSAPVHSITMAQQGPEANQIVATASWDGTVRLFDINASKEHRVFEKDVDDKPMSGLYAVAFAKTAPEILGSTSCDHHVYLWNHQEGTCLAKLRKHTSEVNDIDFHQSQQVMCTASDDCTCIIWDFKEGIVLRQLESHTKPVYGCTFLGLEHQYYVATCCFDQKARIFDMRERQVVALLESHSDDIIGIDFSPSRSLLATGSDDGKVILWDTRTWMPRSIINTRKNDNPQAENEVKRVAFSPDGNYLAAACSSGQVQVYDMNDSSQDQSALTILPGHTDCVFDVAWGEDKLSNAKILVSASHDHQSFVWKATSL